MKRKLFFLSLLSFWFFPKRVLAVCPVCTVAVGAGVGLCRFLGIDDTISGVWIGGLIWSSGWWLADFLRKKEIKIKGLEFWATVFFFLVVLGSLYWSKMIGITGNTLWGVDKIILGVLGGSLAFGLGVKMDGWLRKMNNGEVFIYFQKVILPVFWLAVLSLIFYYLSC